MQFILFIDGAYWDDLPELHIVVCRLRFLPVTERCVEAPHGLIKKGSYFRNVTPQYCSIALRQPEWEKRVENTPDLLMKTLKILDATRSIPSLANMLGLAKHPLILQADAERRGTRKTDKLGQVIASVMYSDDDASKYAPMAKAKMVQSRHTKKQADKRRARGGVPNSSSWPTLMENCALQHFKIVASPGRIYSLPLAAFDDRAGMPAELMRLESKMKIDVSDKDARVDVHELLHPPGQSDLLYGSDDDAEMVVEALTCARLMFSVVEANPSKARVVPIPPGAGRRLGPSDVMVAVHKDFAGVSEGAGVIGVAPSQIASNPILMLSRFGARAEEMVDEVLEWKVGAQLRFTLNGLPYERKMVDLITRMLMNKATPGSAVTFASSLANDDETSLLQRLAVSGYADCVSNDGRYSQWRLSTSAVKALQPCRSVHSPLPALRDRMLAIGDKSAFEVLLALRNQGWRLEPKGRGLAPYRVGGEKVFTTKGKHCRFYTVVPC